MEYFLKLIYFNGGFRLKTCKAVTTYHLAKLFVNVALLLIVKAFFFLKMSLSCKVKCNYEVPLKDYMDK